MVKAFASSPDGKKIIRGSKGQDRQDMGRCGQWCGCDATLQGRNSDLRFVAISPEIVSGGADNIVKVLLAGIAATPL